MKTIDSQSLLAQYARSGSEPAFCELVARYIGLVYSTALRLVGGDTHLAEDVAQMVFIDLARKARGLSSGVMLGGWLHQRTYHVAAPLMRSQRRRQSREREAAHMSVLQDDPAADWAQVKPLLDEAITQLGSQDRTAIILRFFEQSGFRSIGEALGINEDAARMRVHRALDKLHVLLKDRGVTLSAAALGSALATEAVAAAPAGMAMSVTATALASAAGGATAPLLKLITMTKLQALTISALVVAGVATSWVQHQARVNLRNENAAFRQQIALLQSDNETLSNRVAQSIGSSSLSSDRLRELLRLRGEVGLLRRQRRELEQAATTGQKPPGNPGQPTMGVAPQPNTSAPFQVQLVLDEPGENSELMTNNASGETLHVHKTPLLDHTAISSASVTTSPSTGASQIDIELSDVGRELFAAVTKENINKRLAIVLDGHFYLAPVIRSEIPDGKVQVTGSFTEAEARELAARITDAIKAK